MKITMKEIIKNRGSLDISKCYISLKSSYVLAQTYIPVHIYTHTYRHTYTKSTCAHTYNIKYINQP